ncbi:MAG: hypothetical protein AAF456_22250 [Planctomycetota bacterium]
MKFSIAKIPAAITLCTAYALGCLAAVGVGPEDKPAYVPLFADESATPVQEEEAAETQEETEDAATEEWGHLTGKFVLTGDTPEIPDEVVDKDQEACIVDGVVPKDNNLIVGENGELSDVFVFMYFKDEDSPRPEVHPSYDAAMEEPVVLDNVQCRFVPHAAFVRVGQKVILKNSDDVGHNCRLTGFNNEHNINLGPGSSVEVMLEYPENSPGNVSCDIHKWMDSVFFCREEPYVAVSAEDGTFTIQNIPEGTWEFQFWHKKAGYMRKLNVEGHDVGRRGNIEVTITNGETLDLGEMTFDADDLR